MPWANQCTFFVWLWGALVVLTLTATPGGFLQRLTCASVLRTFGKYSYALYLFHGHMNRLFEKLGFNPNRGVMVGGSILPWQMVYLAASFAASLAVAYLSWHLYEKHFLRLKVFFPTGKRSAPSLAGQPALSAPAIPITSVAANSAPPPASLSQDR